MPTDKIRTESRFLRLFENEVSLRYLLPVVCFYTVASLSLYASAILFYFCFATYMAYTIFDAYDLIASTHYFWLSTHGNFRKGFVDISLCLLQLGLSLTIAFCFFSKALFLSGVLSPEIAPHIHALYQFVVEHIFRSGFLLCSIFVRQSLQNKQFAYISSFLMQPTSASIMALVFSALALAMNFPFTLGFVAVPYVFISTFYCLDIISNLLSLKAFSSDIVNNTPETTITKSAIFMLHLFSFALWSSIFGISLQLSFISLPGFITEVLMRQTPKILMIPVHNITPNMILALSSLSIITEFMRDFIYSHSNSNYLSVPSNGENNGAPSYSLSKNTTPGYSHLPQGKGAENYSKKPSSWFGIS